VRTKDAQLVLVQHDAPYTRFILRGNGKAVSPLQDIVRICSTPADDVTVQRSPRLDANVKHLTSFYSGLTWPFQI
jgi:hypothetical protein